MEMMSGKDALDVFISDKEQQANADMETHWGAEAGNKKVDTGAVDNVEKSLRNKIEVFSGYRNNPLQTIAKIFVDFGGCNKLVSWVVMSLWAISLKLNFGD